MFVSHKDGRTYVFLLISPVIHVCVLVTGDMEDRAKFEERDEYHQADQNAGSAVKVRTARRISGESQGFASRDCPRMSRFLFWTTRTRY